MTTKAPRGLGAGSRKVWRSITDQFDLNPAELRVLEDACHEVDLIDQMEAALAAAVDEDGEASLVVAGSMGQEVAHPLLQEIRQHRAVLTRLFAALKLPAEDDGSGAAAASSSARELANRRWHGA